MSSLLFRRKTISLCVTVVLACAVLSTSSQDGSSWAASASDGTNLARRASYEIRPVPSQQYPDSGGVTLNDGERASSKQLGAGWVGFDQGQPEITFDFGRLRRIDRIEASFLSSPGSGVNLPDSVKMLTSLDGEEWLSRGQLVPTVGQESTYALDTSGVRARYARLVIERTSWLLIDEVTIVGTDRPDAAPYRPIRNILVVTSEVNGYDENRSRLVNLLEGMGLPFDVIQHDSIAVTDLYRYQLVIVAAASARQLDLDAAGERQIIEALANGVNFLWIGSGIWGTFKTTDLPEAFGLRYIEQDWNTEMGITEAYFTGLDGKDDKLTVQKEIVCRVEAIAAETEQAYSDADDNELAMPFITRYQANEQSGVGIYISLPILDYWKTDELPDTYARAEVIFKYIRELTGEGTVGKHSTVDAHEGVYFLRLEDHTPGGKDMGHSKRLWFVRFAHLVEMARENGVPLNIALVSKYAHPYYKEYHDWMDDELGINIVRRYTHEALANGGILIVHGYKHQNGTGRDDFSGDDWEMWDEDRKRFLPFDEQRQITDSAFAEVAEKWQVTPKIWETPHYIGNPDTYRAAMESGFKYCVESDTKLFPNRDGFLNDMAGNLLNIPETGFDYPDEGEDIKEQAIIKQKYIFPRLMRMNGIFQMFFHNDSVNQYTALENMLVTTKHFDVWQPNIEQYAAFWEDREKVEIDARIDPMNKQILADVTGAFEGFTLSVRLPDGSALRDVTIDGVPTEVVSRQLDGIWYVYPVLPGSSWNRVIVRYQGGD